MFVHTVKRSFSYVVIRVMQMLTVICKFNFSLFAVIHNNEAFSTFQLVNLLSVNPS